jgi:tetratricopeptide (TPR) repeat protein
MLLTLILFLEQRSSANYDLAQQAFRSRDYTSAAPLFFQAYAYPKDQATRYKAEWGLAQSLQKMGFLYSASKYYSVIVRRGPTSQNPYFRKGLEELGAINNTMSLGQSHIVQLFKTEVEPENIPGPARGFYFYYKGIESFRKKQYDQARSYFQRVSPSSSYYLKAMFHMGVVSNISGEHSRAISYFERVRTKSPEDEEGQWLREQANLNVARVHYETRRYREAIRYYAEIPRESDNWLEAIFEASWAFFLMQNHNNALGNIHTLQSPFFENRFFPESYILQAITFLRLCRYTEVKRSLTEFRNRYSPVLSDVKSLLDAGKGDPKKFFQDIYDYRTGELKEYKNAWAILDALSRTDSYREAGNTIRFADSELARLSRAPSKWQSAGLLNELDDFLKKKKIAARNGVGRILFDQGAEFQNYLRELSNQTKLINAEMLLGKVDALRSKLNIENTNKKSVNFIGGMKALSVGDDLEYWPFEGEYWEDELGGYVYNINDKCTNSKKK